MFIKDATGGYLNVDNLNSVYVEGSGTDYVMKASFVAEAADVSLSGVWPSLAAAEEAMRELFQGVDPATYGD